LKGSGASGRPLLAPPPCHQLLSPPNSNRHTIPCPPHPNLKVSEKILALDEEARSLRLEAAEADARSEALAREKGQLQELVGKLHAEMADKMALLDEFEAKFARQYRCARANGGLREQKGKTEGGGRWTCRTLPCSAHLHRVPRRRPLAGSLSAFLTHLRMRHNHTQPRAWEEEKAVLQGEVEVARGDARQHALAARGRALSLGHSQDGERAACLTPPGEESWQTVPTSTTKRSALRATCAASDAGSEEPDSPARRLGDARASLAEAREREVLLLEAYEQLERDVGVEVDRALGQQVRVAGGGSFEQ
jgi:hypothetical protein